MNFSFLICSERGGSNLLLRMVDAHRDYIGPAATHLIRIMLRNSSRYGDFSVDSEWNRFVQHTVNVFNSNELHWESKVSVGDLVASVTERSLASLVQHIYGSEAQLHGKSGVFIKEVGVHSLIPYLVTHFPYCKFVYLVRDPRDVALSWKNRDWWWSCGKNAGVRHAAKVWRKDQETSIQQFLELRDTGRIVLVRYEDLLKAPEKSLGRVCDCLEIPFRNEMLSFHSTTRSQEDSKKRSVFKNLSKPLIKNNVGKFISGLTPEETQWIEHWCAREMNMLGYKPYYKHEHSFEEIDQRVAEQEAERLASSGKADTSPETQRSKDRIAMLQEISAQQEHPLIQTPIVYPPKSNEG